MYETEHEHAKPTDVNFLQAVHVFNIHLSYMWSISRIYIHLFCKTLKTRIFELLWVSVCSPFVFGFLFFIFFWFPRLINNKIVWSVIRSRYPNFACFFKGGVSMGVFDFIFICEDARTQEWASHSCSSCFCLLQKNFESIDLKIVQQATCKLHDALVK
jgi:hypothetical protein